jgi:hypothetical protein
MKFSSSSPERQGELEGSPARCGTSTVLMYLPCHARGDRIV